MLERHAETRKAIVWTAAKFRTPLDYLYRLALPELRSVMDEFEAWNAKVAEAVKRK